MSAVDYYNKNAQIFFDSTFQVDMHSLYEPFLKYLSVQATILDLGCGSGRDTLAFKNKGFQVDAIDYSVEMVARARGLTGLDVQQLSFYELNAIEKYDGVWACASLLHCERDKLPVVLKKIIDALKPNGVLYMSFKYGNTDREKERRKFTDLDEEQAHALLKSFNNILLLQQWITIDKRIDRTEEWLNILIQKRSA
ncbi:class I SAM-dependent methyltransferase [Acinetobacter wuhouensis]|uniref:Class I SAM-dependent methyltransferase n=1 Tax=Acinetobacter wuhouensis TaxID=1879050 RepID=A0A4Q7AFG1_9GAMM|nr:class I SAM-dependent methyltransferase [Acinetobacter wuhouensis]RZG43314.1 class I SAM-dependent methyltransferase [Acinetobacter wuhouensis]